MYPQSMFCAKKRKNSKISSKNEHFYSHEILLYISWACFRNGLNFRVITANIFGVLNFRTFTVLIIFVMSVIKMNIAIFRLKWSIFNSHKNCSILYRLKKKVNCFSGPPSSVLNAPHLSFLKKSTLIHFIQISKSKYQHFDA